MFGSAGRIGVRNLYLEKIQTFGSSTHFGGCRIWRSSKYYLCLIGIFCELTVSSSTRLLATTEITAANQLISDERLEIASLLHQGSAGHTAAKAAISYLDYLMSTWMAEPLWQSWSQKGRSVASAILKIPIEGVLPTTNHLESFNGLLKRKYIPRWQRSGSRLRFDFLIRILIIDILPSIFASRISHQQYRMWLASRFTDHAGGVNLVELKKLRAPEVPHQPKATLCWWIPDAKRDNEAHAIVQLCRLHSIRQTVGPDQYEATCISTSSLHNPAMQYTLFLHRAGHGRCDCPDFLYRGGACKHLRALRLVIESWVQQCFITPFHYPLTIQAAELLCPVSLIPTTEVTLLPVTKLAEPIPTQPAGLSGLNNFVALRRLAGDNSQTSEGLDYSDDNKSESDYQVVDQVDTSSIVSTSSSTSSVDHNGTATQSFVSVCTPCSESSCVHYFSLSIYIAHYTQQCTWRGRCYSSSTARRTHHQEPSSSHAWAVSSGNRESPFTNGRYRRIPRHTAVT